MRSQVKVQTAAQMSPVNFVFSNFSLTHLIPYCFLLPWVLSQILLSSCYSSLNLAVAMARLLCVSVVLVLSYFGGSLVFLSCRESFDSLASLLWFFYVRSYVLMYICVVGVLNHLSFANSLLVGWAEVIVCWLVLWLRYGFLMLVVVSVASVMCVLLWQRYHWCPCWRNLCRSCFWFFWS